MNRRIEALSEMQKNRYSRHLALPELGEAGQLRLMNGKALVIGAGGLGSPVALYLTAAGVGTIGIVEFDCVDHSNLQRQVLYGSEDVGKSKAEMAEKRLRALNPEVTIIKHHGRITAENALEWMAPYDVIINGTDNFPTRYLINDACVLLKKVNVDGSIFRFEGLNTVFAPHLKEWRGKQMQTGCYRCQFPEPPPADMAPSCAVGGVMGAMCGIVGSVQANEALKILAGIGTPLFGRLQTLNALDMEIRTLKLRRDKNCPACGDHPTITKLMDYQAFCGMAAANPSKPVATAAGMELRVNPEWEVHPAVVKGWLDGKEEVLILDVRMVREQAAARIAGSRLMPLAEVDGRCEAELSAWKERRVVVHCHRGVRSLNATAILRRHGFTKAYSLAGGIDAWSLLVDAGVPRYSA